MCEQTPQTDKPYHTTMSALLTPILTSLPSLLSMQPCTCIKCKNMHHHRKVTALPKSHIVDLNEHNINHHAG